MQITMAEYLNHNQTEKDLATGYDDTQTGKISSVSNHNTAQDNGKCKKGEVNASLGEATNRPADEKSIDEPKDTCAAPAYIYPFIEKKTTQLEAAGLDKTAAESFAAIQEEGIRGLVGPEDSLLNETADNFGKQHKEIFPAMVKKNNPLTETNPTIIPEMKNQLVMLLEGKGIPADAIEFILTELDQAIAEKVLDINEDTGGKSQSHKELDHVITTKTPEAQQLVVGKSLIEPAEQSFRHDILKILEKRGFSTEGIKGALRVVKETTFQSAPVDSPLKTKNQQEIKNRLVTALEGKGIPQDDIEVILMELDQIIMAKAPEVKQDTVGKSPAHIESISPSFRQTAGSILKERGFSAEEIKGILKAVGQGMVGLSRIIQTGSEQPIFVQESLYHREFIKEAIFSRNNIHADIYQKETSLEDFRHEKVEGQLQVNPPEKQLVKEGAQKELLKQYENTQHPEKKNVFSVAMEGAENRQTIKNEEGAASQKFGRVITVTAQEDQGKLPKLSVDVSAKTSQAGDEEIIFPVSREKMPLNSDILSMNAKGLEFHPGKINMDNSKSIYQSVVDQIKDSFAIAQDKDNGQVRLTLKPEILGHLDMQIAVRNETVQIMMTVENEKIQQAMNAHIDDLKTALNNQGLKIDRIEVTLQNQPNPERNFYQDQTNSWFNNHGQNSHHERMLNRELYLGEDNYPKNIQEIIQKQNNMEGVSIFA